MSSSYWKPEQFRRHGHLVVGIEVRRYSCDPSLAVVAHEFQADVGFPEPPASFLALLAYSCLASPFPASPHVKLAHLAEDAGVRELLKGVLGAGSGYLVEPGEGQHLTCLLDAVPAITGS